MGFRASTAKMAKKYSKVKGFVKNLEDGRVEAVFNGPDQEVLDLVSWCKKGPFTAKVTHLEVIEEPVNSQYTEFEVITK